MNTIRAIRSRLGVSQVQLAEALRCTQGNISSLELGAYGVSPELAGNLIAFARSRGLELSYDHIYGDLPLPEPVPTIEPAVQNPAS